MKLKLKCLNSYFLRRKVFTEIKITAVPPPFCCFFRRRKEGKFVVREDGLEWSCKLRRLWNHQRQHNQYISVKTHSVSWWMSIIKRMKRMDESMKEKERERVGESVIWERETKREWFRLKERKTEGKKRKNEIRKNGFVSECGWERDNGSVRLCSGVRVWMCACVGVCVCPMVCVCEWVRTCELKTES